ncbi:propionyl-CoA synthetase [Desulfoprunum benzoelyticum]|uniref:Propionyl-CoA synthetase n=1 Tax=Desulfoprunum benzoelyticum TaxID=1506996 RepID=A0A840UZE9_9BACT|nr:propionyl-CoA synthetase [Desulfoprunum benzoelyticum]MBB5346829.1 propionyl-CoA synthetase [Desulfoprunum benzoelyticum]MBM9531162.1 propionyl-CoA synthetase [Desulfoprunum benzoelyticum]
MSNFDSVFQSSVQNREAFWAEAAKGITWYKQYDKVLDSSNPPFYRWFVGGKMNTCYNAVDRHVENGRADQTAIIYDSPVTNTIAKITYKELQERVALFAGALQSQGVTKGDTVVIYMPMIPEAAVAMLACARLGAIHSVVFGGFAAHELAIRIDHAQPKLIITASGAIEGKKVLAYKPLVDSAIDQSVHEVKKVILFQRDIIKSEMKEGRDFDWNELVAASKPVGCVELDATDPLYILYTSGTTGMPKGVLRDNGGHAVALLWTMKNLYNINPGEVWWSASDVGWVVGHSYIVYAPLIQGSTTILYEGKPIGTPDAGAFWRVISQHGVKSLFTAPTAFRAIKKEDPNGEYFKKYDTSCFECLYLAGERLDPDTLHWAEKLIGVPVIDHWWQTETGWAIVGNCRGIEELPVKEGSPTKALPGYDVHIVNEEGTELAAGQEGNIVIRLPLPPGNLVTLWRNDERFVKSYMTKFPGYYDTSDGGYIDQDGYVYVMGRMDDVINVAGHRLSTGAMEEIISNHPDVAECAVFGTHDDLKGQLPLGLFVVKAGVTRSSDEIKEELVRMVRDAIGPIACFRDATQVARLPKTRSGKILRGTMRAIAGGKDYNMPSTIDDPAILDEITATLAKMGYPKR